MALPLVKTTVDSILAEFSKTVEKLNAHRASKLAEADKHAKVIALAEEKKSEALSEATRAETAASKISALLA